MKLFVYGTLRQGETNHYLLRGARRFPGLARIKGILYWTPYGYPAAVEGEGTITGEVYEIADYRQLEAIDRLEGYLEGSASNIYDRQVVEVEAAGEKLSAWVYFLGEDNRRWLMTRGVRIESGDWLISSELVQLKLNLETSVGESTPTEAEYGTPTYRSGSL